jgi:methylated-DNA-[protein]-cysteine S-methyltransferase
MDMTTTWTTYESPFGALTLVGGPRGLARLYFPGHAGPLDEEGHDAAVFADAIAQLEEYFAGRRRHFELALDLQGTPFQRSVWAQLAAIPHGETRAYGRPAPAPSAPPSAAPRSRSSFPATARSAPTAP